MKMDIRSIVAIGLYLSLICGQAIAKDEAQGNQLELPPLPPPQANGPSSSSTFGTVHDPAFKNMTKKEFPLTPEQIKALHEILQATQRASMERLAVPTPVVSQADVDLAPGSIPPVIRMANGYVTSAVFLDETGQPWPISSFSVGNPKSFNIQWDKASSILMIQGIGKFDTGNLAVRLHGLDTPLMITMVSDQKKVDYRIDLRVQGRGPNAKTPIIGSTMPRQADPLLMDLLEGVPPLGSQRLTIKGGAAQAWLQNNQLLLRTRLTLLSPSWEATMSSADGTHVYALAVSPVLLASQQGKTVTLRVEGL